MNGYNFTFGLVVLALLITLGYLAVGGSLAAGIALAIITTVVLILTGALIALAVQKMANQKAQADFVANARENMAIMAGLQRTQNLQNQTLMQQLGRVARLPEPTDSHSLLIDEGIFSELED